MRFRLPPEQKKLSAPVRMRTRTESSRSAAETASIAAAYMSGCKAFFAPGLESASTRVASRREALSSADIRTPEKLIGIAFLLPIITEIGEFVYPAYKVIANRQTKFAR